ncbi:phosphotransferase [Nakamurella leprariae]|uniref:Phosphotransferase n=1 Tax=Nakamurella leprariae TaxID=2803911 RepID=A0A938YJ66_9ACTN|nr:phosphotransferase [Nakamurella leprariae]MBM9469124.1 phosphotransferase [Nakamurella leprariae]
MSPPSTSRPLVTLRSVPLTPGRLELAASGSGAIATWLYRPSKLRGQVALAISTALRLRGKRASGFPFELDEVIAALGVRPRGCAVMRSPDRQQWVIAIDTDDTQGVIAKIGMQDQRARIREEYRTLRRLADHSGLFSVPIVNRLSEGRTWSAFDMERVADVHGSVHFDLDEALAVSVELARVDDSGITHGDLAPWNLLHGERTWLIDWERARALQPGLDLAHYVLASADIGGMLSSQDARDHLRFSSPLVREYCRRTGFALPLVATNLREMLTYFDSRAGDQFSDR